MSRAGLSSVALWCSVFAVLQSGCIKTTAVTVSRKTTLERQLLGELKPLDEQELSAMSVRAQMAERYGGVLITAQEKAMVAKRRQRFNRDDLEDLLSTGCAGEALNGTVVVRPCRETLDESLAERRSRILAEENEDRRHILAWVIASDPSLDPSVAPDIARIYHELRLTELPEGAPYQAQDSEAWVVHQGS